MVRLEDDDGGWRVRVQPLPYLGLPGWRPKRIQHQHLAARFDTCTCDELLPTLAGFPHRVFESPYPQTWRHVAKLQRRIRAMRHGVPPYKFRRGAEPWYYPIQLVGKRVDEIASSLLLNAATEPCIHIKSIREEVGARCHSIRAGLMLRASAAGCRHQRASPGYAARLATCGSSASNCVPPATDLSMPFDPCEYLKVGNSVTAAKPGTYLIPNTRRTHEREQYEGLCCCHRGKQAGGVDAVKILRRLDPGLDQDAIRCREAGRGRFHSRSGYRCHQVITTEQFF